MGEDVRELIGVSAGSHNDDRNVVGTGRENDTCRPVPNGTQEGEDVQVNADSEQIPLPDFATLGIATALRIRRETLGWSLPDVASWLRIRLPYLEALEQGHPGELPGNAYAVGFLRTYASALGFPAEQVVSRFKRETRGVERKPELEFPTPEPERTVPAGAIVLTGIVVVIGAYIGWYRMAGHDPVPLERVPPVASVMPGVRPGPMPSPQIASMMPDAGPSHVAQPQKTTSAVSSLPGTSEMTFGTNEWTSVSRTDAGAASPLTKAPASTGTNNPVAAISPDSPSSDIAPESIPVPLPAPPEPPAIKAIATSWVQVKASDGKVIYNHIMQPGDNWLLPDEGAPFILTAGNAGGITLVAGNIITTPLGRNGAVRRNITLSRETILDGSIAGRSYQSSASDASSVSAGAADGTVTSTTNEPVPLPPPPVIKPRVRPATKPGHESSADDLNAMQLRSMSGTSAFSGQR
ncbi:helix-turn-helix domain-containing protein [Acetobacter fallax]|uniref:DUF4115 domain-containing protein n=1 Tax=Acetobacter fallax TaxID=1737473 RepID=A0ABX0K784_9PROT|nr:helix-turn-helix domain-containing protein [Acetobacter fallax]NHO31658.1 DUF4115 domain-containing protein [Acetobacter fallax]NHO35217.1 DUF4115 domain-containing protein [Acetobacter fallax]